MYPYYLYDGVPGLDVHKIISEIDVEALESNYALLSKITEGCTQICVVKADAYGHTSQICVPALLRAGCRFFAVSCIEEAMSVRDICNIEKIHADILILGYTDPSQAKLLSDNDIIQTAISVGYARRLSESASNADRTLRIHIAIDTGMNRIGLCANADELCMSAAKEAEEIVGLPSLKAEGMFTHFARSDEETADTALFGSATRVQAERFFSIKDILESKGIKLFCHICNSAAAIRFPEYRLDGVRLGITLYGVYPSEHFDDVGLKPVMSLSTVISHIHKVPYGGCVSYGGTFCADRDMRVATLPIGYADGLLRKYSGVYVTVISKNKRYRAKIIGRICMDQCMIDVTDTEAEVGDKVTVFGEDPRDLARLSKLADTIEYECLCLVSARVPRIKKHLPE